MRRRMMMSGGEKMLVQPLDEYWYKSTLEGTLSVDPFTDATIVSQEVRRDLVVAKLSNPPTTTKTNANLGSSYGIYSSIPMSVKTTNIGFGRGLRSGATLHVPPSITKSDFYLCNAGELYLYWNTEEIGKVTFSSVANYSYKNPIVHVLKGMTDIYRSKGFTASKFPTFIEDIPDNYIYPVTR